MPESSSDWPQTSTVLLDHIRSLRQPIPSETFTDSSVPDSRTENTLQRESPTSNPDLIAHGTSSSHPLPSPQLRNAPAGQRLPRPAAYTPLSSEDSALTPRERLRAFLAPSSSTGAHNLDTVPADLPASAVSLAQRNISSARKSPNESPSLLPTTSSKSPSSNCPYPSTVAGTSYLDSTMSSISSTAAGPASDPTKLSSHSPSLSLDVSSTKDDELSAARVASKEESPMSAIQAFAKEKAALMSRNEQLWKLVEKQRAMILGLNQDLEKAVRDRERYRKKLKDRDKETLANTNPTTITTMRASDSVKASSYTSLNSGQGNETTQSPGHNQQASIDSLLSIRQPSSTDTEPTVLNTIPTSTDSPVVETRPVRQQPPPLRLRQEIQDFTDQGRSPATSPSSQTKSPSMSSPTESKRKAPPQPLDLSQAQVSSRLLASEEAVDSGSDYDETSPQIERGRRKTREEDDRLREAAFLEEERRSRSNKESKGKSKSHSKSKLAVEPEVTKDSLPVATTQQRPAELPAGLTGNVGLPTSPRAALLGGLQSPLQSSHESISSVLRQLDRSGANKTSTDMQSHPPNVDLPLKSPGLPMKSPGLPMSPRPGDRPAMGHAPRLPNQQMAGPGPMSPRSAMILSPRAPRQPIPLPPSSPFVLTSPHVVRAEQYAQLHAQQTVSADRIHIRDDNSVHMGHSGSDPANLDQIHRDLVSEQYPELLLPPNALPVVEVKVDSSRLRPSRNNYHAGKAGEEELIFTLAVHSRSNDRQLWRVEKALMALPILDQSLRRSPDFNAKLPDKNLFIGHAPARLDLRRSALNQYFSTVLDTPLDEKSALAVCDFLSSDAIGPRTENSPILDAPRLGGMNGDERQSRKEGYLAKKGKQLGGWKARYFVLDKMELRYFEGPNGGHLGNIKLHKAQIAKQNAEETAEDAEYRHAFMILEPKRRDSSSLIRHVLCAESDAERDDWVVALLSHVDTSEYEDGRARVPKVVPSDPAVFRPAQEYHSASVQLQSIGYDQTVAADAPTRGSPGRSSGSSSPIDNSFDTSSGIGTPSILSPSDRPSISGPVAGGPIQNSQAWGNKSPSLKEYDHRKRNLFGFRSRVSEDSIQAQQSQHQHKGSRTSSLNGPNSISNHNGRAVFGISLNEAADFFAPNGVDICLPAPVYRCIEYLEARNATNEEGIFRMSGSNVVIKQLKARFNTEGDVKLLEGQYYDIHAIASLLKLYLRELPESVLTRELHLDFLKVLETEDRAQKIGAVNILAHRLPEANFELLATLSRFLIDIVNNADVNKMNVRNVGIVFAPTLNIPAPLISLFLTDHEAIFGHAIADSSSPVVASLDSPSISPVTEATTTPVDDLRSPRKQMFTDLATPGFNQTSFNPQVYLQHNQHQGQSARADFDTGSNHIQRSYETTHSTSAIASAPHTQYRAVPKPPQLVDPDGGAFGSLNAALAAVRPSNQPSSTD